MSVSIQVEPEVETRDAFWTRCMEQLRDMIAKSGVYAYTLPELDRNPLLLIPKSQPSQFSLRDETSCRPCGVGCGSLDTCRSRATVLMQRPTAASCSRSCARPA